MPRFRVASLDERGLRGGDVGPRLAPRVLRVLVLEPSDHHLGPYRVTDGHGPLRKLAVEPKGELDPALDGGEPR